MNISIQLITPEIATKLLASNTMNRRLRKSRVAEMAGAMARGEWRFNGDAIRIAETGELLDGQHRLHACIAANIPFTAIVVSELPKDVFSTIDFGAKRSNSDVMFIRGEKNSSLLAATARLQFIFEQTGNPYTTNRLKHPSPAQIVDLVQMSPDLRDCAKYVESTRFIRSHLATSCAAFCKFNFDRKDSVSSAAFFSALEHGRDLGENSPVLMLRDRLIHERASKASVKIEYKCALMFKAFKLFRFGHSIKYLRVRQEGDSVEKGVFVL